MIFYRKYLLWILMINYCYNGFERNFYNSNGVQCSNSGYDKNYYNFNRKPWKKIFFLGLIQTLSQQSNLNFKNIWLTDDLYSCSSMEQNKNFLTNYQFNSFNKTNQKCQWLINDNCQLNNDFYNNNLGKICQNINYNGNCNPNNCQITFSNYLVYNNELSSIPCQKSLPVDQWFQLNQDNYEIIKISNFEKCENTTIGGSCSGINHSNDQSLNGRFCNNKNKSLTSCMIFNKKKEACIIKKKNNNIIHETGDNNYFIKLENNLLTFNGNANKKNITFQKNNNNVKYLINTQYNNQLFMNISNSKKIFIENNNNFFSEISDFDSTNIFFKNKNFQWKIHENKIIFSENQLIPNINKNYQILNHLYVFFQNEEPAPILTKEILFKNSIEYIKYKLLNNYLSIVLNVHNPIEEYQWTQLKNIYQLFINKPVDEYYNSILLNLFNKNIKDLQPIEKIIINNQEIVIKKDDLLKILENFHVIFHEKQISSLDMIKTINYVGRNNLLKNHIKSCLKNKSYNVEAVNELRKIEFPEIYDFLKKISGVHFYKNINIKDNDYIISESSFLNYIYDDFIEFLTLYSTNYNGDFIITNNVLLDYYTTEIINNFNKISLNLIIIKDFDQEYFLKQNDYIILTNNNIINKLFPKNNFNENFIDIINGKDFNPYSISWNNVRGKRSQILVYDNLKDVICKGLNNLENLFRNKPLTIFDNTLFKEMNTYYYKLIFNILKTYSQENKNNNINNILEIIDILIVNKNSFSNDFLNDFSSSNTFSLETIFNTVKNNIENLNNNIIENFFFYLYNFSLQLNNQLTVNFNDENYQFFLNNIKNFFHKINTIDQSLFNKNYQSFLINILQGLDYYFNIYQRRILKYHSNLFFSLNSLNFYNQYFIEKLINNNLQFTQDNWHQLSVEKNFLNCKMNPISQCFFFHNDNNLTFNLKNYKINTFSSCNNNNCLTNYEFQQFSLKRHLFTSNSSLNTTNHYTNVNNNKLTKNLSCKNFSNELLMKMLIFNITFLSIIIGEELFRLFYSWCINCCYYPYPLVEATSDLNRYKLYVNFHRNINSLTYTLVSGFLLINQYNVFNSCNKTDDALNNLMVTQFVLYCYLYLLHSVIFNKNNFGYRYISHGINLFLFVLNITILVKSIIFGWYFE